MGVVFDFFKAREGALKKEAKSLVLGKVVSIAPFSGDCDVCKMLVELYSPLREKILVSFLEEDVQNEGIDVGDLIQFKRTFCLSKKPLSLGQTRQPEIGFGVEFVCPELIDLEYIFTREVQVNSNKPCIA